MIYYVFKFDFEFAEIFYFYGRSSLKATAQNKIPRHGPQCLFCFHAMGHNGWIWFFAMGNSTGSVSKLLELDLVLPYGPQSRIWFRAMGQGLKQP